MLLSRLLLEGVTEELLPYLQKIDPLASLLPDPFHADDAAAVHYHIFGFNVFAFESVFLGQSACGEPLHIGGEQSRRVAQFYRATGFSPAAGPGPDHIACELELMASLCGAEADAWEDGLPKVAQQMQERQRDFLQVHLLRWLPALNEAIRNQGYPFYHAIADLAGDLVMSHALFLLLPAPPDAWLPHSPQLLEDEKTGVKEIAHFLTTPSLSGFYLSRKTCEDLARELNLPRGFGSRRQLVENLIRAAAQYGAGDRLLAALAAHADGWAQMFQSSTPSDLRAYVQPWQQRATATCQMLQNMAGQL